MIFSLSLSVFSVIFTLFVDRYPNDRLQLSLGKTGVNEAPFPSNDKILWPGC